MKKIIALSVLLVSFVMGSGQSNSTSSILGSYTGYQESYVAGQVMDRDIVIPGCDYLFTLGKEGRVTMKQSADNGQVANYKGSYRTSVQKNGAIVVTCNLMEISNSRYPSKPSYKLTFEKDKEVVCEQIGAGKMNSPALLLNKTRQ